MELAGLKVEGINRFFGVEGDGDFEGGGVIPAGFFFVSCERGREWGKRRRRKRRRGVLVAGRAEACVGEVLGGFSAEAAVFEVAHGCPLGREVRG